MIKNLLLGAALILSGSLPALGAQGACPGEGLIKSASTDINSEISFTNNSNAARQIFWIDFDGARVQYGNIAPGATHIQPTFLGHVWIIANQDDECLGIYFAESASRTISLNGAGGGPAVGPVGAVPPRINTPPGGQGGGGGLPGAQSPVAVDGNPCNANEFWNRSRNLCVNKVTKARRTPGAGLPNAGGATIRTMRCRPGFVQEGRRCVRQSSALTRPQPPRPQPAPQSPPRVPANVADAGNEENRPDDICGPGFTDIGGGCISNSLLNRN